MVSERRIEPFTVYLVKLEPTIGAEMNKARPCAIISPEMMHRLVRTVIIAPLTSKTRQYPMRVPCRFQGRAGEIALDQMRAVDRARLLKVLGKLDDTTAANVRATLLRMFK